MRDFGYAQRRGFAADGCITVNKRGSQYWAIQIIDQELLEKIKKSIDSDHAISMRKSRGLERTLYRLQIGSREMCDDLRALGFSERKTHHMVLPQIPDAYAADFIRGYFDGDGNVWTGKNNVGREKPSLAILAAFTSCSEAFLNALHDKLISMGIQGGSLFPREGYYRLSFSVLDSLKLFEIMYNNSTLESLLLRRKKEVFTRFIAMRP